MAVTPSGPLSLPLDNLRTLLANCPSFQTWVGAADAAEALAAISLVAVETVERPLAIVMQAPGRGWASRQNAGGAANWFSQSGTLLILFEDDVEAEAIEPDAELTFTNLVGAIISEMQDLAGSGGHLNVTSIAIKDGPSRSDFSEKESTGDYYQVVLEVGWAG